MSASDSESEERRQVVNDEQAPPGNPRWFRTTHWSVVIEAGEKSPWALEQLCRTYWSPLYTWVRWQGRSPDDAMDLTQGFFEHLLQRNTIAAAEPAKGRFRSYLIGAMKKFLSHETERANAIKRGGSVSFVSLEQLSEEERDYQAPANPSQAEREYDRRWALKVLERARTALREDYAGSGKQDLFDALQVHLSDNENAGSHAEAAKKLQMSEGAIKVAVYRLRHRFARMVREELAQTLGTLEDVEDELRYLLAALRA